MIKALKVRVTEDGSKGNSFLGEGRVLGLIGQKVKDISGRVVIKVFRTFLSDIRLLKDI